MSILENKFFGYMKSVDENGNTVFGNGIIFNKDTYLVNSTFDDMYNETYNYSNLAFCKVNKCNCAKYLAELPNGTLLFEYDVYKTVDGIMFYIIFDYTRMAIVYICENNFILPDGLNIFDCEYVGNIKIDDGLVEYFE